MESHSNITPANGPFLTQREKLRALFDRREGEWIPLPDIQALGIAQHGARVKELRREYARQGFQIENRMETGQDGIKRSWYRKVREPFQAGALEKHPVKSWEQVCAERDEKMHRSEPEFELMP